MCSPSVGGGTLTKAAKVPSRAVTASARIVAVAVSLALAAAPAAAFAQNGAGDDQYADPFSGGSQPANKPKPKPKPQPQQQQTAPSTQQTAPSTQQTAPSTQQSAPSSQQSASSSQDPAATVEQSSSAQGQLPRTGLDVVPLALAGAALLLAGLFLLRRSRAVDGRD